MIRVVCPSCGAKLTAKEKLAGQTRKCPKCGKPVAIARPDAGSDADTAAGHTAEAVPERSDPADAAPGLRALHLPERMNRQSHWLVCGRSTVVAAWENNGKGWMLVTRSGPVSARRNQEQIPNQGDFTLVEVKVADSDQGHRLVGITCYQLAQRWALTKLIRGDDKILSAVSDLGSLSKQQKSAVRDAIRERFMPQVWENSPKVLGYLANTDYHSPGV